jgi:hypothetical protein
MAKNAKVFFEVNFAKEEIGNYIREHFNSTGEDVTDETLSQVFVGILSRIVEEAEPELRQLYTAKDFSHMQIKIIGLKEEPKTNNVVLHVTEDNVDVVAK